jgi:glycosyltransferase involved in cell wall biosynthesis
VPVASAYATRAYEIGIMKDGMSPYQGVADRLRWRAWARWVRSVDNAIEGWGYARSRVVLVNYQSVERLLVRAYGPELNLRRIPYCAPDAFRLEGHSGGSEVPAAAAALKPAAAPLVLAVSRQDPRKGLDLLLLALARVRAAGIPFRACLVGTGRLLEAQRRLAAQLGFEGQIAQPGEVPDVAPYLSCADVFVLPSLGEASGSVSVLEALRAGKAVIASACDGLPEDLRDGQDALLVAPGDVSELAGALGRLLTDPALRDRLASSARRVHERRFSAERFVAALADVYDEVCASTAPRRLARTASAT